MTAGGKSGPMMSARLEVEPVACAPEGNSGALMLGLEEESARTASLGATAGASRRLWSDHKISTLSHSCYISLQVVVPARSE